MTIYATPSQKNLTHVGYYANTFARQLGRDIERLTRPMPQRNEYCAEMGERLKRAVSTLFSFPLAVTLSVPAIGCYSLAAYIGSGRFELITPATPRSSLRQNSIRTMSLNACFQDPFSPLTGGIPPPQEPIGNYPTRVAAIVHKIAQKNPDLFLGQEFDSLGAQNECIQRMQQEGLFHYFLVDRGCNSLFNHSGLFVASKFPLNRIHFVPYPLEDRAGAARWAGQGALTFTIDMGNIDLRFVNVHLNYGSGEDNENARKRQLKNHVAPLLLSSAYSVLFGDLNLNTAEVNLSDLDLPSFVNELEGQVTCTDAGKHLMRGKSRYSSEGEPCPDCEECIDGLVYHPDRIQVTDCSATPLAIEGALLTDHFATVATLRTRN